MRRLAAFSSLALALAWSEPAPASTVSTHGHPEGLSILELVGGPERNVVSLRFEGFDRVLVSDQAGVEPGPGCELASGPPTTAVCSIPPNRSGIAFIDMSLGAGDDEVLEMTGEFEAALKGGSGDDVLRGGEGPDRLDGGPGDDQIYGLGGPDVLQSGPAADGPDDLSGGEGVDLVTYEGRARAVAVSLDGEANDGEDGEGDRLRSDVESVKGGLAADTIVGSSRAESLIGDGGGDLLRSGGGEDFLNGQRGADRLDLRDGDVGIANCGDARDMLLVDRRDMAAGNCERVLRPGPAAAVPLGSGADSLSTGTNPEDQLAGGGVAVDLGCPVDVGRSCRGSVRMVFGGRTVGSRTFFLRPGQEVLYDLQLGDRFRRRVRRQGPLSTWLLVRSRDARGRPATRRQRFAVLPP